MFSGEATMISAQSTKISGQSLAIGPKVDLSVSMMQSRVLDGDKKPCAVNDVSMCLLCSFVQRLQIDVCFNVPLFNCFSF